MICSGRINSAITILLLFLFSIILGGVTAALWFFGVISVVVPVVPYAGALALVIILITIILLAVSGLKKYCLCKYAVSTLISGLLTFIACLVILATEFICIIKLVLAFAISILFWFMILAFAFWVVCFIREKLSGEC